MLTLGNCSPQPILSAEVLMQIWLPPDHFNITKSTVWSIWFKHYLHIMGGMFPSLASSSHANITHHQWQSSPVLLHLMSSFSGNWVDIIHAIYAFLLYWNSEISNILIGTAVKVTMKMYNFQIEHCCRWVDKADFLLLIHH